MSWPTTLTRDPERQAIAKRFLSTQPRLRRLPQDGVVGYVHDGVRLLLVASRERMTEVLTEAERTETDDLYSASVEALRDYEQTTCGTLPGEHGRAPWLPCYGGGGIDRHFGTTPEVRHRGWRAMTEAYRQCMDESRGIVRPPPPSPSSPKESRSAAHDTSARHLAAIKNRLRHLQQQAEGDSLAGPAAALGVAASMAIPGNEAVLIDVVRSAMDAVDDHAVGMKVEYLKARAASDVGAMRLAAKATMTGGQLELDCSGLISAARELLSIAAHLEEGGFAEDFATWPAPTFGDAGVFEEECALHREIADAASRDAEEVPGMTPATVAEPASNSTSRLAENVPGLAGEIIGHTNNTAHQKQPVYALLATFAAMGAVYGRRYATRTDFRSNLYCLGIGATGSGKNHARVALKKLFAAAGMSHLIGGDKWASSAAMMTALVRQPSMVHFPDEFGETLKAAGDPRAPAHLKGMSGNLLELYTSSNTTIFATEYASDKSRLPNIVDPNLCLYGVSTVEMIADALTSASVLSGLVGRIVTLRVDEDYPADDEDPASMVPPASLVARLRESYAVRPKGVGNIAGRTMDGTTGTALIAVDETAEASEFFRTLKRERVRRLKGHKSDRTSELWARYPENSMKFALIRAVGIDPVAPIITLPDLEWAAEVVRSSCGYLSTIAREHVSDNAAEAELKKVLRLIKAAGDSGIALNAITHKTGTLGSRRRMEIINDLIASEQIEQLPPSPGVGRPVMRLRLVGS